MVSACCYGYRNRLRTTRVALLKLRIIRVQRKAIGLS